VFPHTPSQLSALELGTTPPFCKLPLGAVAPAKVLNTTGSQRLYLRNTPETTPTARPVLGPVDGSPTAGGLTSSQPFGYTVSSSSQHLGFSLGSTPPAVSPHLGLDPRRRKRPADPMIFVDDEFRDGLRGTGASNSAPNVASVPSASSTLTADSDSSAPGVVAAATQPLPTASELAGAEAEEDDSIQAIREDDVEMEEGTPGKENKPPEPFSIPSEPSEVAALTSTAWSLPGSSTQALAERGAPLAERFLEVPLEYQEHQFSDIDESSDEEFQSENLADRLSERIQQNADGRYDFEIFTDP